MVQTPDVIPGDIKEIEKDMIQRVFNFSETSAEQVMTPLYEVDMVQHDATVQEALHISEAARHNRLPVFDSEKTNVVGLIDALEILGEPSDEPALDYIRPIYKTDAATSIADLLTNLRTEKVSVGIVTKEGEAIGLISLEDIMEEVVADIEDEYDQTEQPRLIRQLGARNYLVNARISIKALDRELQLGLKKSKAASLAGMILQHYNEIPKEGTNVEINGVCYTVNKASPQAILDVQITW